MNICYSKRMKIIKKLILSVVAFFGAFLFLFLLYWALKIIEYVWEVNIIDTVAISLSFPIAPFLIIGYIFYLIWKKKPTYGKSN